VRGKYPSPHFFDSCEVLIYVDDSLKFNVCFIYSKVVTKASTIYFSTVEDHEKADWLTAFQQVAFKGPSRPIIEEDNDLYCSSGEGKIYFRLSR